MCDLYQGHAVPSGKLAEAKARFDALDGRVGDGEHFEIALRLVLEKQAQALTDLGLDEGRLDGDYDGRRIGVVGIGNRGMLCEHFFLIMNERPLAVFEGAPAGTSVDRRCRPLFRNAPCAVALAVYLAATDRERAGCARERGDEGASKQWQPRGGVEPPVNSRR